MNKIVTLCGSMRFKKEMLDISEKLELKEKYLVIQCIYSNEDSKLTKEEIDLLGELHYKKIEISDAIFVVNVGGYIGQSTKNEIEYARSLNKEILSLEPLNLCL